MPRLVDHDQRRATILNAFVAVAIRDGLHTVSLRQVAAEAGISLRLVQYYFKTKAGLMQAGLSYLEQQSNERWKKRLTVATHQPTIRATLQALCAEALPNDRASREFQLLWMSYTILALTTDDFPDQSFTRAPNRLHQTVTGLLQSGIENGEFDHTLDANDEAGILLGLIHGLGTAILIGQQEPENALALLNRHLNRL
ncbi:TetR/AcrR family transcriptional regulator [Thalassospira sp.]|uniref:TetR/AcrR family transcriptional regulator n=1 Tax=Thalassospira sp. TaxID=1912094 RepID=UPI003AA8BB01